MRYTFSLSRRGALAVAIGSLAGTALVFAAGLLVGAAAAVPETPLAPLAVADSAALAEKARADSVAAADSAAAVEAMEVPAFSECQEPPAAVVSWDRWTPGAGQLAPLRAVDLPDYDAGRPGRFGALQRSGAIQLPDYTGGPDPYAEDEADGRTMGTFTDELEAMLLMHRISAGGQESYIDTRLGPDGVPVFRVRTGSPEEAEP